MVVLNLQQTLLKATNILFLVETLHLVSSVTFSPDASLISLPSQYNLQKKIDVSQFSIPEGKERVPIVLPITTPGQLCALNRISKSKYVPVGRSYDGHEWESPAGLHFGIQFNCDDDKCEVNVPKEYEYYLTCYNHYLQNRDDIIARFLEKATFGPTPSLIDTWESNFTTFEESFASFVKKEMNKEPTFHREYFRKRLNPKSLENYKYGTVGPHACKQHSRWRKYAFTRKDAYLSSGDLQRDSGTAESRPNPRYQLTIEEKTDFDSNKTAYILSYAGEIRTIVYEKLKDARTDEALDITTGYYICDAAEIEGSVTAFRNDAFSIKPNINDRSCIVVKGGNPKVQLDTRFLDMSSVHILNFTQLTIGAPGADLIEINKEKTLGGDLMLQRPIDDTACHSLPDPSDNDYRSSFISSFREKYPMWTNPSRFNMDKPIFAALPGGSGNEWAIHDYRLLLKENTVQNPLMDGGGQTVLDTAFTKDSIKVFHTKITQWWFQEGVIRGEESATFCANAVPTLFNQDDCKISFEPNSCESGNGGEDTDIFVTFDETFMSEIRHNTTGISPNFIVAMDGLVIDENRAENILLPCEENAKSRWVPVFVTSDDCEGSNTANQETINTFAKLLVETVDNNPLMRDVYYYEQEDHGIKCHPDDILSQYGFRVKVTENGIERCFENVHPDHLSLYDITEFANNHTKGIYMKNFSSTGILNYLEVPDMTMSDWDTMNCVVCPIFVGRMGDTMSANNAANSLVFNVHGNTLTSRQRSDQFLEYIATNLGYLQLKGYDSKVKNGGVLVCGSPGEVGQDYMEDNSFDIINGRFDSSAFVSEQKVTVWTNIALEAHDQLRQRVAWALSQMLNISPTTFSIGNEGSFYLYDIYVRHAFGNYRDILREMSFNPKVAEMLTFLNNAAVRFNYDITGEVIWPDENYARELMQLYTIGLHKLHMDGSPKLDRYGNVIQTYDTDIILSMARAWTGFGLGPRRGNVEELDHTAHSYMEPMEIHVGRHDFFPKMNLDGGYIGDQMPLCWDLPERAFLRKGAKFFLLSNPKKLRFHFDPSASTKASSKRLVLDSRSHLYKRLCNPSDSGDCQFQGSVTLEENLGCFGIECKVVTAVVVQVAPGVFYEYVQRPCVQLAFYEGAKKVTEEHNRVHMCAHPKMPVAMTACCGTEAPFKEEKGTPSCQYSGEQVTYEVNVNRCSLIGGSACDHSGIILENCNECCSGYYNNDWPEYNGWYWTNEACSLELKVRENGLGAIVHQPAVTTYQFGYDKRGFPETAPYVSIGKNMNYFSIHWPRDKFTGDKLFPTIDNGCWDGDCEEIPDGTCLCSINAEDKIVFSKMPTRASVLSNLRIGAFEVDLFDPGHYRLVESSGGVDVYAPSSSTQDYTQETIFKVTNKFGDIKYLKNMESVVKIGSKGQFEMQNPAQFIDLAQFELRDVYNEIEAVIDNVFYNDNTPPFIAKQLIKRFGISNPSPRYIKTVAMAFFSGIYEWKNVDVTYPYGDRKYGNLEATIAAILLDREAMSVTLDADPSHGSLREPLIKTISFMRAMEYRQTGQDRNEYPKFHNLSRKIGQQPYNPPDQFSFFSPEYMPVGAFTQAGLVSPEAEILTMSQTVGMVQGFFSLARNGLNDLMGGFGFNIFGGNPNFKGQWPDELIIAGNYDKAVGYLSKLPTGPTAEDKVDELATLLTSGRVSPRSRDVLVRAYNDVLERYPGQDLQDRHDFAWKTVQQLISTMPEFHSTNLAKMKTGQRKVTPPQEPKDDSYKAVIVLFLFGGLDSFNLLIPDASCGDLYESYEKQRGSVKIKPNQMLQIDAKYSKQPCDKFGIHNKAPTLKDLYDDGEGVFIANMGHLDKFVTKDSWRQEITTELFSHTSLEREAYSVDPFKDEYGTGILGRLLDVSQDHGYAVGSNAIDEGSYMLGGDPSKGRTTDVIPGTGPPKLDRKRLENSQVDGIDEVKPYILDLNADSSPQNGLFADHWSQNLIDTWNKTEELHEILSNNPPNTGIKEQKSWPHGLPSYFRLISQMIKGHKERKKNRDVFFIRMGGFDAHADLRLNLMTNLRAIDTAFMHFREEMKSQDNYDKVTVVMASEFGRTITPNAGGGTDHAWGGNYFMFGGGVKGGKIVGTYPSTFWDSDDTNIGRGRIIPTLPWDALWFGVSQWFGVENEKDMKYVLPNNDNFGCSLLSEADLYKEGTKEVPGCGGVSIDFEIKAFLSEPRYLLGDEQRKICDAAKNIVIKTTGQTARCLITDQKIIISYTRRLSDGTLDKTQETLKEYLKSGGSRTRRLVGDPIFTISAKPLLSYNPEKLDTDSGATEPLTAIEMTQTLADNLEPALMQSIRNMTGLGEVAVTTMAPTVSLNPTMTPSISMAPSLNPTVSHAPSLNPTKAPTASPSSLPTLSFSPSQAPSYMDTYVFDMLLFFDNQTNIELDEIEQRVFCRALRNQLDFYQHIDRDNFLLFSSQEVLKENFELKVSFALTIGSSNDFREHAFENQIITEMALPTTEYKVQRFLNDREIMVTGVHFLSTMSVSPTLSPSISLLPSVNHDSTSPSLSPSLSIMPSLAPSHLETYSFDMILCFENREPLELDNTEVDIFIKGVAIMLRDFQGSTGDNFVMFSSQEVLEENAELKVSFTVNHLPSHPVRGEKFENQVITQLTNPNIEERFQIFLNDREIMATCVNLLNTMSVSPTLSPSISLLPSINTFTSSPSFSPSLSIMPSLAPSYLEKYYFDMVLYFKNREPLELDDKEAEIFSRVIRNMLRMYQGDTDENFVVFSSQEVLEENTELKVSFIVNNSPLNAVTGDEFENEIIEQLRDPDTELRLQRFLRSRRIWVTGFLLLNKMSVSPSLSPLFSMSPTVTRLKIQTSLLGTYLINGHMFNVAAKENPVRIVGLDVITKRFRNPIEVLVWTKKGSYQDSITTEDDWTLVHRELVPGKGFGQLVSLEDFNCPIDVQAYEEQSFYVTSTHKLMVGNEVGKKGCTDAPIASDDIIISESIGLSREFERVRTTAQWMGSIRYELSDGSSGCDWKGLGGEDVPLIEKPMWKRVKKHKNDASKRKKW